jgi:cytochrome c biogenesis protein CcmG/thiol:disulfide interchange protein DsbE
MRWRRLLITVLPILAIVGVLAYGFHRDPRYISSPLIGHQAPPFTLTLFDGKKLSLDDLRGKAVFINFWSSWCSPCRAEARQLEASWQRLKDRDLVFLGIDIQDTDQDATAFLKEFGVTYSNGRDPSAKIAIDYGVWGIPESFFIDPEGRITYKHVGALEPSLISAKLEEAGRRVVSAREGKGPNQSIR